MSEEEVRLHNEAAATHMADDQASEIAKLYAGDKAITYGASGILDSWEVNTIERNWLRAKLLSIKKEGEHTESEKMHHLAIALQWQNIRGKENEESRTAPLQAPEARNRLGRSNHSDETASSPESPNNIERLREIAQDVIAAYGNDDDAQKGFGQAREGLRAEEVQAGSAEKFLTYLEGQLLLWNNLRNRRSNSTLRKAHYLAAAFNLLALTDLNHRRL